MRILLLMLGSLLAAAEPAALLDHIAAPRIARDLGGRWEYCVVPGSDALPEPGATWRPVVVPGEHKDLFKSVRTAGRVWFRTSFELSPAEAARRIDLHCERAADRCLVLLNGTVMGESTEGWSPFTVPLTAARAGGNELMLGITSMHAGGAVGSRPIGLVWFYQLFTGLTMPVHIEIHDPVWIAGVAIAPLLHGGTRLRSTVEVRNATASPVRVRIAAAVGAEFTHAPATATIPAGGRREVVLEDHWADPPMWWPHDPQLRHLHVTLEAEGAADALRQRFGFREVRVDGPDMLFNGVRMLHRRESLICYRKYADGSELDAVLHRLRERGYNGLRLHLGPALRIARRCDELGFLVSPESAICQPGGHAVEDGFWAAAADHLDAMVDSMRNSPSVIYWCISNEFGTYYMPPDERIPAGRRNAAWVDAWQAEQVRRLGRRDPTRIAVASGNVELAGRRGAHGPSPAQSLHYGWQPWKLDNQLPQTADWPLRRLRPWQGVAWDRRRPLMLSEDLYEPYCFKIPHGISQWAGDAAYDPLGAIAAVRDAYRIFAAAYYRSGVAVWNPWGIDAAGVRPPSLAGNLHADGALMPEHLVAWRGAERCFVGGQGSERWVDVHDRGFRALADPRLRIAVRDGGTVIFAHEQALRLGPGASIELPMPISMPDVGELRGLEAALELLDGGRVVARRDERWLLLPDCLPRLPAGTRWLGGAAPAGAEAVADMEAALAGAPALIVVARQRLDEAAVARLLRAAADGCHVLWIETPDGGVLPSPLQPSSAYATAHAFVRAPHDAACAGLDPALLAAWRPQGVVCAGPIAKGRLAGWDVLLDVGGPDGLGHAAVARREHGAGILTVCQLPIVSALAAGEPAAAELLRRLAAPPQRRPPGARLLLVADASSPVRVALARAEIPHEAWTPGAAGVLLVDAAGMGAAVADPVVAHLATGGTVVLHQPGQDALSALSARLGIGLRLTAAADRHLVRRGDAPFADGLSNDDLWWQPGEGYDWLRPERSAGKPAIIAAAIEVDGPAALPFAPAGLAVLSAGGGRLAIDQVRWSSRLDDQPVRALRYARTVLRNLGTETGAVRPVLHQAIDLEGLCNVTLAGGDDGGGWPGPGRDDLRYFPVNRTGMDPRLGVPAPVEPLPRPVRLAGIPFHLVERSGAHPLDAIVPAADETVLLPATGLAGRLWLAGGNASWIKDGQRLLVVEWCYADGGSVSTDVLGGVHAGPVQERTPMRAGLVGWSGPTPQRDAAVVWVWPLDNPQPARPLTGIVLRGVTGTCAVVGATLERAASGP